MDSLPTADEMLAQVPTETMQSFLTSLRHAYPIGSTCILALDGHISSLDLQRPISLSRGDVLEIQGPAASGKSHLLYHLLATCILPSAYSSVEIRGWECAAVLFDTDGKFSVKRFSHLLLFRLSQILRDAKNTSLPAIEDQALEDMVGQCLSRLHIFRPSSSAHLATTLMHLPDYHSTHPSLRSYEIGLLAIDSLSAFYWNDRFLGEQWRTTSGLTAPGNAISTEPVSPLRQVIVALQSVRVMRGPLTVLTNWGLNSLGRAVDVGEQQYPLYKQHLHPFPSPFDAADADALPSRTHREPTQLQSSVGPLAPTSLKAIARTRPRVHRRLGKASQLRIT
ncbi:uncharacterized protein B0H18DRAFT_188562 [Fomitopsis serialis]|uniref:uncharacterized protein n=1 Tax=Fomitopsis serialis TaxID=139415 RepID=UPI0020073518|nr:uncharacterized protein B0H18DRAFT_188562 [Neoantrodia serialis]KAH9937145.1 hypothetical protein B0H18DRAFT_188562 [Neoantrodia serialis]